MNKPLTLEEIQDILCDLTYDSSFQKFLDEVCRHFYQRGVSSNSNYISFEEEARFWDTQNNHDFAQTYQQLVFKIFNAGYQCGIDAQKKT